VKVSLIKTLSDKHNINSFECVHEVTFDCLIVWILLLLLRWVGHLLLLDRVRGLLETGLLLIRIRGLLESRIVGLLKSRIVGLLIKLWWWLLFKLLWWRILRLIMNERLLTCLIWAWFLLLDLLNGFHQACIHEVRSSTAIVFFTIDAEADKERVNGHLED